MDSPHHVVIVGGGFGGLYCAQSFRRTPVRVTVLDRRNFHLFQPLLYQVATGSLSPANIAAPLRSVLQRQRNVEVLMGNRLLVLLQGVWNYLTWNRFARLITGENRLPFSQQESKSVLPSSRRTTNNGFVSTKDNTLLERQELTRGEANEYHCC
ncbi:MAG: FAD-dependent oxidoreductase [Thermoguttaceae bacterium]